LVSSFISLSLIDNDVADPHYFDEQSRLRYIVQDIAYTSKNHDKIDVYIRRRTKI